MSRVSLLNSVEITINSALKRLNQISGADHKALEKEYKEWLTAMESGDNNYDYLYLNKN